ncbi:MAG TPA: hypothetical protein VGM86_28095 [Thermoanaerobaculia bacterium]|jgi:hypothetical protein
MATKGSTVPERIARWKVISAGLKPLLGTMPHLADLHGQLEQVIAQSEELDARAEALKAESRAVNANREALAKSGDDLRGRLGASLQTTYGFKNEKLIEFGLKPRKARGRDKQPRLKKTQGGTTPADTTPETPKAPAGPPATKPA